MHDGVRQISRPAPLLVRWSGAGAFQVSWECLISLNPMVAALGAKPTPAQFAEAAEESGRHSCEKPTIRRTNAAGGLRRLVDN